MCGILGAVRSDKVSVSSETFSRALREMEHRGPDAQDVWSSEGCTLGHRRLKIIDLRDVAGQPMQDESKRFHIVFNGEIYNFPELKKELINLGHRFVSDSDTEVLLKGFIQWREQVLSKLVGMFSFAIWDSRERTLFAARDRAGQKPFFYHASHEGFYFSSTLASLKTLYHAGTHVDYEALVDYLQWQGVLAPRTIYKEFKRLPPAHYLIWKKGQFQLQQYWQPVYLPKLNLHADEAAYQLENLLKEAVRSQMVGDVPVGSFLSGGVDSSVISYWMAKLSSQAIQTYSIGVDSVLLDESSQAEVFAQKINSKHQSLKLTSESLQIMSKLIAHYGEPFADSSAVPSYFVSKLAKPTATVVLNGDGGDELFLGYPKYQILKARALVQDWPMALKQKFSFLGKFNSVVNRLFERPQLNALQNYSQWTGHFTFEDLKHLNPEILQEVDLNGREQAFCAYFTQSPLALEETASQWDFENYLGSILLNKIDVASMAHGVETRSPFLDHRLMEFAFRLPVALKMSLFARKKILRKAMEKHVGSEIFNRRKRGFSVPLESWLQATHEKPKAGSRRFSHHIWKDNYLNSRRLNTFQRWNLRCLDLWQDN